MTVNGGAIHDKVRQAKRTGDHIKWLLQTWTMLQLAPDDFRDTARRYGEKATRLLLLSLLGLLDSHSFVCVSSGEWSDEVISLIKSS